MIRAVADNLEERALAAGLSRRLATRLLALARQKVWISEVVLELLADPAGLALRELVLSPEVLEAAAHLDTATLTRWCGTQDYFHRNPLQVIKHNAGCVLALIEEGGELYPENPSQPGIAQAMVLATQAHKEVSPKARVSAPHPQAVDADAVKLVLLTSTDPSLKIEALRKLSLAAVDASEKAMLLLIATRDADAGVRAEAVKALGRLGLQARLTEMLAQACVGPETDRLRALESVARALGAVADAERMVACSVLVGLLETKAPPALCARILEVLATFLDVSLAGGLELGREATGRMLGLVEGQDAKVFVSARALLLRMSEAAPEPMTALMREYLATLAPGSSERLLLSVLVLRPDRTHLAQALSVWRDGGEFDSGVFALESALRARGIEIVPELLDAIAQAPAAKAPRLFVLLAELRMAHPENVSHDGRIGHTVLAALRTANPQLQSAILDAGLLRCSSIDPDTASRIAQMLLVDAGWQQFSVARDRLLAALVSLGPKIVPVLRDAALQQGPTQEHACQTLPALLEAWPEVQSWPGSAHALADLMEQLLHTAQKPDAPARGMLLLTVARLAAHASIPAQQASRVAQILLDHVDKSSSVYAIMEGLGWLAGGDSLDAAERERLCLLLLDFLCRDLPDAGGKLRTGQGERQLELGAETSVLTDMIPRLLSAFRRIVARRDLPKPLWDRIVAELVGLFGRVVRYQVVWAPASMLELARILADAGEDRRMHDARRSEIAELLLIKADLVPISGMLARLCVVTDEPAMTNTAYAAFVRMRRALGGSETPEAHDHRDLISGLLALLSRTRIAHDEGEELTARREIVELTVVAIRKKIAGVVPIVRRALKNGTMRGIDPAHLAQAIDQNETSINRR